MSSVSLTRVAHQESKLLIWLHLSAQLVNRDKDIASLFGYTHKDPERVYKLKYESLRAQDSAIQKPDQNRNNISHSVAVNIQETASDELPVYNSIQ